ncbi:hypothetical protein BJ993_001795 [Nocardioides aromaticivorans]|uniref:DUF559 domain-containing protein n=1 Tax=Nocardioides aromaticivorans TaxID=200618 RepID=A0A7Z0CNB0_9ACTN|nr:hypothetical protein [Nocardioides aromaticivorans]NYI44715.1 hypothetical protein [Nocardioides aromaticivorans]
MRPDVHELAARQCGLLARRQLTSLGMSWNAVDRQVRAGRWAECSPRVVCTTTGALTVDQQRWLGVLHAGPRSVLGGLTAGARCGLRGWERAEVTVLVDDELAFEPVSGIAFFRSRRPFDLLTDPRPGIPCARLEPAILLWAGYDAPLRAAHGVLAATVQQRLTTAARLSAWVEQLRPLRRAAGFRSMLRDVEGGVHSGAERDVARLCRRFDLPFPDRQTIRVDTSGRRRWTDCEWRLPGGRILVLEVDGAFHMEVTQWTADLRRDRRLTAPDRMVVRASAYELRHEPAEVAADLVALGVRPLRGESCA